MRDPIDRVYSWYRYRHGNKVGAPLPKDMDFTAYWKRRDWTTVYEDGSPRLQRNAFIDENDKIALDLILPYHDLAAQFARLALLLGVEIELGQSNKSVLRGTSDEIDPGVRSEMEEHFRVDCELYGALPTFNAQGWARLESR